VTIRYADEPPLAFRSSWKKRRRRRRRSLCLLLRRVSQVPPVPLSSRWSREPSSTAHAHVLRRVLHRVRRKLRAKVSDAARNAEEKSLTEYCC